MTRSRSSSVQAALKDPTLSPLLKLVDPKRQAGGTDEEFQSRAARYYHQLTVGCQKVCDYPLCASSSNSWKATPDLAALLSVQLATNPKSYFCPRIGDVFDFTAIIPTSLELLLKRQSSGSSLNISRSNSRGSLGSHSGRKSIKETQQEISGYSVLSDRFATRSRSFSALASKSKLEFSGLRRELSISNSFVLPTVDMRSGDISPLDDSDGSNSQSESDTSSRTSVISTLRIYYLKLEEPLELYSLSKLDLNLFKIAVNTRSIVGEDGTTDSSFLLATIQNVFSSVNALSKSFRDDPLHKNVLDLKISELEQVYYLIMNLPDGLVFIEAVLNAQEKLMNKVYTNIKKHPNGSSSLLRLIMIVLLNPILNEPKYYEPVLETTISIFDGLKTIARDLVIKFLATIQQATFTRVLKTLVDYLETLSHFVDSAPKYFTGTLKALKLFSLANEMRSTKLSLTAFYAHGIISKLNFKNEYRRWRKTLWNQSANFSLFHYPFIFDPISKTRIMHIDAMVKMSLQYEEACVNQSMVQQAQRFLQDPRIIEEFEEELKTFTSPYFVLEVRRTFLINDTFNQLADLTAEYGKPLKIKFVNGGEEGLDQGGVQKEFFQLLIDNIMDPAYGMFEFDEETRYSWFSRSSLENLKHFELFGIIIGLALYNGIMVRLLFPSLFYKKLLKEEVTLSDLKAGFPVSNSNKALGNGLEQLLTWKDGNVSEIFMRSFEITYEKYGQIEHLPLVPNGEDIPVSNENRSQFVKLYIEHFVSTSISKQFNSFRKGFYKVCGNRALHLCRASELELLICGKPSTDVDLADLEFGAEYDDGYHKDHTIIRWFWNIVHQMDMEHKRYLLEFVTSSDRIPLKGLEALQFVIQRNGPDTDRLPTALTCFGRLLLPEYSSSSKLENRLYTAIENSKGFGLV